jgi:hypothetical protein
MSQDLHSVNLTIPYGTAIGTAVAMVMPIPGTAYGGGIYLVRAAYCSNVAIAAGSAPAIRLVTLTSAGAVIATVGANGSAALTAGTPIAGTISTPWIAGTVGYLGLEVGHEVSGPNNNPGLSAVVQYYMGRGSA